jgi:geranylgeranylglycerol-phosphate geranylgeranyltransferase
MEDVKGDKLKGIKTFPQIAGLKKATDFNIILLISLIFLDMLPFIFDIYGIEYFVIIMVFVNPIFFYTMFIIYKSNELSTLRKASNLIKLNMLIGLVAILIGA